MAAITVDGSPSSTNGDVPAVGTPAPDFRLVDAGLSDVTLARFKGKRKVISIVPSLETSVCAQSTRRFNQRAATLDNAIVLVVSADLPLAQQRVCGAEGIDNVTTLSMMRSRKFAKDYGVLITSGPLEGIAARAVIVLDEQDKVLHSQLVPEIGQEPDYDAALRVLS